MGEHAAQQRFGFGIAALLGAQLTHDGHRVQRDLVIISQCPLRAWERVGCQRFGIREPAAVDVDGRQVVRVAQAAFMIPADARGAPRQRLLQQAFAFGPIAQGHLEPAQILDRLREHLAAFARLALGRFARADHQSEARCLLAIARVSGGDLGHQPHRVGMGRTRATAANLDRAAVKCVGRLETVAVQFDIAELDRQLLGVRAVDAVEPGADVQRRLELGQRIVEAALCLQNKAELSVGESQRILVRAGCLRGGDRPAGEPFGLLQLARLPRRGDGGEGALPFGRFRRWLRSGAGRRLLRMRGPASERRNSAGRKQGGAQAPDASFRIHVQDPLPVQP
jgi:hypothetical protein